MSGYWLSSIGNLYLVDRHIYAIRDNLDYFGFSKEEFKAVFEKHDEPEKHEGYAREEIIFDVFQYGWIRIREHNTRNEQRISVQCDYLNEINRKIIAGLGKLYSDGVIHNPFGKYAPFDLMGVYEESREQVDLQTLLGWPASVVKYQGLAKNMAGKEMVIL